MNLVDRILTAWYHADEGTKADGLIWYDRAHDWAAGVAKEHGVPEDRVFAVVSALSPNTRWEYNMRDAVSLICRGEEAVVTTYPNNKAKALRLLAGSDPVLELCKMTSLKTWNFYNNIKNPKNGSFVTCDDHIAWLLQQRSGKKQDRILVTAYRRMVQAYFDATAWLRRKLHRPLTPCQVQAVNWGHAQVLRGLV